ncbi:DUF2167 domain-containing protein [Hyphococcus lacteus]|uniref:DUF2167 domain-containing protein n=1 Tax=Hyphococcus lacteus TaxID=3143536 RepID=A0ABV3Z1M4_9PROT
MTLFNTFRTALVCSVLASLLTSASAQDAAYEYAPNQFTDKIDLARGSISPIGDGGFYLTDNDACQLVVAEWGWEKSLCGAVDKIIIVPSPAIDTLLIEMPNSDGYITYDDWNHKDRRKEVDAIWQSLEDSVAAQGDTLGIKIQMDGWLVEPTLNTDKNYLYYATRMTWDGNPQVNIKAATFDRKGYVNFLIIPTDPDVAASDIVALIDQNLTAYESNMGIAYADFIEGDKVASYGVLGVLAGLVGVKYSKVLAAGLGAILLGFAKKLWFLIFAPLVILWNRVFGKKGE